MRFHSFDGEWSEYNLGEVVEILDNLRKPIKETNRIKMTGEFPYYGASGVIDHINKYIFDGDFVLLSEDGANIIDRSSRVAFEVHGKCWINNHAHVLKTINHNLTFISEYLESKKYDEYNTGTAQPKLNQEVIKTIPIFIPKLLEEEHKIADLLAKINSKIETQNKIIEEINILKKAIYNSIFGSNKFESTMYLLSCFLTTAKCSKEFNPNREKLITVKLNEKGVIRNKNTEALKINSTIYYVRKAGQFIYGKQNIFNGAIGIVPAELDGFLSSNDVPTLDFLKKETSELVLKSISYSCYNWEKYASGTGSKRIHEAQLLNCQIPFPNEKYVPSIIKFLKVIDKKNQNEIKLLNLYKTQKNYLLQNLFI